MNDILDSTPFPNLFEAWSWGDEKTQTDFNSIGVLDENLKAIVGIYYLFIRESHLTEFYAWIDSQGEWSIEHPSKYDFIAKGLVCKMVKLGSQIAVYTDAGQSRRELKFIPKPACYMAITIDRDPDSDQEDPKQPSPRPLEKA